MIMAISLIMPLSRAYAHYIMKYSFILVIIAIMKLIDIAMELTNKIGEQKKKIFPNKLLYNGVDV